MTIDGAGNLYGTTPGGGKGSNCGTTGCGTVFKMSPPVAPATLWTYTTLATFNGANGRMPRGGLVFDTSGNLFGTTSQGGLYSYCNGGNGCGTVFILSPPASAQGAWSLKTLANFSGVNGTRPVGNLAFDASWNLYGAAEGGGPLDKGTLFKVTFPTNPHKPWALSAIVSFNGTNGAAPAAGVVVHSNGNLYGTTSQGGVLNQGTLFKVAPVNKSVWALSTLASFTGPNGVAPLAGLTVDKLGNMYGTTSEGGNNVPCFVNGLPIGCGTVIKLVP